MNNGTKAVLLLLWMPIGAAISGWTMMTLWGWFVVPLGAPVIGMAHGWGLALMVSLYTHEHGRDKREAHEVIISGLTTMLLVLGFGWIAHTLMK